MNKAIEVLENIIRSLYKEDWRVPKPAKMKIDALSQAIKWGEALQSAEGELPKKEIIDSLIFDMSSFNDKDVRDITNSILDLCKPILVKWIACKKRYQDRLGERTGELMTLHDDLAKKELRILELKQENKRLAEGAIEKPPYKENLQQELVTLKAKIRELEGDIVDGGMKYDDEVIKVAKLQEELEQERVRLAGCLCIAEGHIDETVKQGVYGWSLPYERIRELQQELATLKAELNVECKDEEYQCKHVAENIIDASCVWCNLTVAEKGLDKQKELRLELQQENANLKEEVETVRLESYGEALKNKKLRELVGIAAKELNGLVDILEKHKLVQPKP